MEDKCQHADYTVEGALGAILGAVRSFASETKQDELLDRVCDTTCDALDFGAVSIALLDEDECFRIKARTDRRKGVDWTPESEFRLPLADLNILFKIGTKIGDAIWVDGRNEMVTRLAKRGSVLEKPVSIQPSAWLSTSMLIVPFNRSPEGLFGLLLPEDPYDGRAPSSLLALLLSTLASFASISIQLLEKRSYGDAQQRILYAQRLRIARVYRASGAVQRAGQLQEMLQATADAVTGAGGFRKAVIYLREGELLELRATSGVTAAEAGDLDSGSPVSLAHFAGVMQPQMRISRSYLFDKHRYSIPRGLEPFIVALGRMAGTGEPFGVDEILTVPITDQQKLLGVISVAGPDDGESPNLEQIQELEFFADQAGTAVSQMVYFDELKSLAERDPLTGLFNRRSFWNIVDQVVSSARGAGLSVAALFVDIDHFKAVNDELGHAVGDSVIKEVAKALSGRLRSQDVIARFGGEEFVVLVMGVDVSQATSLAESLRMVVSAVEVADLTGALTISVGVAVAESKSAVFSAHTLVEELIRKADAALYRAKVFGRNRVEVYR